MWPMCRDHQMRTDRLGVGDLAISNRACHRGSLYKHCYPGGLWCLSQVIETNLKIGHPISLDARYLHELHRLDCMTRCLDHDDVIKWKHFPRYWPFVRGSTDLRWISLIKASDAELWCFLWPASEITIEQTTETPVIWDARALIMTSL